MKQIRYREISLSLFFHACVIPTTMVAVFLTVGCGKPVAPKTAAEQDTATPVENRTEVIRPLERDADSLRKLMGFTSVIAFEFTGTLLECWLKCEVDGAMVATSPHARIDAKSFDKRSAVKDSEQPSVTGWLTVWGDQASHLKLLIRAKLQRGDGTWLYAQSPICELMVPEGSLDQGDQKVSRFLGAGGLEADWTNHPDLPVEFGEVFTLRSYGWTESKLADGDATDRDVVRTVRVMLKVKRLPPSDDPTE